MIHNVTSQAPIIALRNWQVEASLMAQTLPSAGRHLVGV
jgi:hypothetical protein